MEKIIGSLRPENPGAKKILPDVSKINNNEASTSTTAELDGQRIDRTKPNRSVKKVLDMSAHPLCQSLLNDTVTGTFSSQNFNSKFGLVDKNLIPMENRNEQNRIRTL